MNDSVRMQGKALNPMLRMAALAGVDTAVKLHIRRGDNLNAMDGGGLTPLMLAASKNRASVCSLLVEAGADPALHDPSGRDALTIARSAGADAAAEILLAFVSKSQSHAEEPAPEVAHPPEWLGPVSLDEDWELNGFGDWEADDEKPPPEGDSSIARSAAAIHRLISNHVPIDIAEDWADFIALLPEVAARPKTEADSSDDLRSLLLRAVREGAVPEESVLCVCRLGEAGDEAKERIVRALLAEAGVEPDERVEEGEEPFMVEPSDEEDAAVLDLLSYAEDLDPWRCDPARCYAREMRIGRLLSAEEEVLLGKEMEQGIHLASKALAGWSAGLNELGRAGKAVASGLADATAYVLSAIDELGEDGDESTSDEEEDDDAASSPSGLDGAFLSGLADISSLRKANSGHITALETAIAKLRLAPSFLLGLSGIAKDDPEAGAFRSAVERYANARESMTVCNLRMVYNVVKRYQGLGLPFDDLLQEGNIGLMKAVERYDWRRGFKFSTYATWWIRQSASRAVADAGRTIRLPVHVNEKLSILRRAIEDYEIRKGNTPSDRALAELVSMPLGRISMLRARMEEPRRLHETDAYGIPFEESLSDEPDDRPDAMAERVALIEMLGRVVSELDERTAEIITMRYGLDGLDSRTLEETGEHFGVTRERVRQVESKALRKLAHPSRSKVLSHFLYAVPPEVETSTDESEEPRNSRQRGRPRKMEEERAKHEADDETARMLMQELESLPDASNAYLDDETVSSMQAAVHARTNALISLACEIGAKVDDKRGDGGGVSVRLPAQRDAGSMLLAKELLGAGFKPYPGQVFAK